MKTLKFMGLPSTATSASNIRLKEKYKIFSETSLEKILNIFKGLNESNASGIYSLSAKFLKDGTDILARPISQLCNLSMKPYSFSRSCKIAKVKPLFKKRLQNWPSKLDPILLLSLLSKLLKGLLITKYRNF